MSHITLNCESIVKPPQELCITFYSDIAFAAHIPFSGRLTQKSCSILTERKR